MSDLPEFKAWPSIQRLSSEVVTITEKADGTNAVVHIADDGTVTVGSHSRWLTVDSDNFGFAAWAATAHPALRMLGPGYHYGEWIGPGIQRKYGLASKRFISFEWWRLAEIPRMHPDFGVVPVLYQGEWYPTLFDEQIERLNATGSVLVPGFMSPEGIVIQFKNERGAKFKKLCENDRLHKFQQGAK